MPSSDYPVYSHAVAAHHARQNPGMTIIYRISDAAADGYMVKVPYAGGDAEVQYISNLNNVPRS